MELRDVLLILHIAGAGTWLGADIVQAIAPSMTARQGPEAAAGWYRVASALGTRLYLPAIIVILASGIWLVLENEAYGFESTFVTIGFAMVVVGALLGILVLSPTSTRAAEAIESGDTGAVKAATGRYAAFGTLDTLLLLFTIAAMVLRLGA